jgi:hypothetical protein
MRDRKEINDQYMIEKDIKLSGIVMSRFVNTKCDSYSEQFLKRSKTDTVERQR